MQEYRPDWAKHIKGSYTERTFDEDMQPEPQDVFCVCEVCNHKWQTKCSSGVVRQHISNFARVHLHRDPLGAK